MTLIIDQAVNKVNPEERWRRERTTTNII